MEAIIVVVALLFFFCLGPLYAQTMGKDDLQRYGFGHELIHTVKDARNSDEPRRAPDSPSIPPAIVPAATATDRDIPEPGAGRLIQQAGSRDVPPYEGPTRVYRGSDGKELEGSFKEIENFFFRPERHYDRFLSMNEQNVTGLIHMFTGEVERKGTAYGRFGFGYTSFTRAFGSATQPHVSLEQLYFPFTAMFVPSKDLEISETLLLTNEESRNFPLIHDYALTGIRTVTTAVKYRFLDNPEDRISLAFLFGLEVGVESTPTKIGSNGVDFRMGLAATKRYHNMGLHADGGWLFANGQDRTNNRVPDVGFADVGVDFQTGEKLDWMLELDYVDFQNIGHRLEAIAGLKWKISEKWRFDLGVPVPASDTLAQGYYGRLTTSFQVRF